MKVVASALLGDEQAGDLALHPRCDNDATRLGQRLRPRRYIRHVTENFTHRVDHNRPRNRSRSVKRALASPCTRSFGSIRQARAESKAPRARRRSPAPWGSRRAPSAHREQKVHAHMLRHSAGYSSVMGTIHARSRTIWAIRTSGTRFATRRFPPSRSGSSGATEFAA